MKFKLNENDPQPLAGRLWIVEADRLRIRGDAG